jgi:ELWxxDGT repeat protein
MKTLNLLVFAGVDTADNNSLWVTNGTANHTHELTGISGAYAGGIFGGSTGFSPDFTKFNGEVLFDGLDTGSQNGLWVSNGTASGTHELTGISGADANGVLYNIPNPDFTVFNSEVLFQGRDAAGQNGLWVTDGTAAGTHEITGISGVNPLGYGVYDLTVLNNKVFFIGGDAVGYYGLWVSDGTAAGTMEIGGPANQGVGAADGTLYPSDLTVFNSEVLFQGFTVPGVYSIWVTDGTVAGTHPVTGISGASQSGLLQGHSSDFTVFNGKVLFNGDDTAGNQGLWVTDGTGAGTHEVTNIKGAYAGGLFGGSAAGFSPDFTVFKNEVLFNGVDTFGYKSLWVTDGTAAGTHEVYAAGLDPTDLTVFNNEVYFNGFDAKGQFGLWVTDGTFKGTHELTGISGAYNDTGGLNPQDLTDPVVGKEASALIGGPGETLTGGNGADTFIFPPNFGDNTITNFDVHTDPIELPKSEFANFQSVLADAHQVGANTVITYDAHDTITLDHVALNSLHAQNFHLV